jgi:hypothetical protein
MAAMTAGAGSEAHISGTITVTRTWIGSGPPPDVCYLIETGNVSATAVAAIGGGPGGDDDDDGGGSTPEGLAVASDGLNDAPTTGIGSEASQGSHVIRANSSSGTITESVTIDADANSAGQPVNCQAGGNPTGDGPGFSWDIDTRLAMITSSLEPTNHKEFNAGNQPIIVPDTRDSDGTMTANTCIPDVGTSNEVIFSGHALGNWSPNSSYLMHCDCDDPPGGSDSAYTVSGNFTMPDDPLCSLSDTYDAGFPVHTYLHLTDATDGFQATTNYYVSFHPQYDQWQHATVFDRHPYSLTGGFNDPHPDWTYLDLISNGGSSPLSQTFTGSVTISITESGTIGSQQTLNVAGHLAFQANESINVGSTVSYTYSQSTTLTSGAHKDTQFYAAMSYENRSGGLCDTYDVHGYEGSQPWTGTWTSGSTSVGTIEQDHP